MASTGLPNPQPNRVATAIVKMRERVAAAREAGRDLTAAEGAARLDFDEYVDFQNLKSQAQASGVITVEEALTVYTVLGNSPEEFASAELGDRIACIKLYQELLKWRISPK